MMIVNLASLVFPVAALLAILSLVSSWRRYGPAAVAILRAPGALALDRGFEVRIARFACADLVDTVSASAAANTVAPAVRRAAAARPATGRRAGAAAALLAAA